VSRGNKTPLKLQAKIEEDAPLGDDLEVSILKGNKQGVSKPMLSARNGKSPIYPA
jgi:hypothetical protein